MWWVDMFHAAGQMAAMKIYSVVLPFASVSIEMEKKFQGVESLRTVLRTVLNSVCLFFCFFS